MSTNNKEYMQKYNKNHKTQIAKSASRRYQNRKEEAKACTAKARLKRNGWTIEAVEEAKVKQDNRCAICQREFKSTPHADHEHVVPPKPRELLCGPCNRALGLLRDSSAIAEAVVSYLKKWGK